MPKCAEEIAAGCVGWRRVNIRGGPPPRERCCVSSTLYHDEIYVLGGGIVSEVFHDMHAFHVKKREWREVRPEGHDAVVTCLSHTAVMHKDVMYTFGGMTRGECHNRLYALDMKEMAWREETAVGPTPRKGHTAVVHGEGMYVLMGAHYTGHAIDDFLVFSFASRCWAAVGDGPQRPSPARSGHSAVMHRGAMYVCGGSTGSVWLRDIHRFCFVTSSWTTVAENTIPHGPPGRYSHVSWFDGRYFFIFGGDCNGCSVYFNDVWAYDVVRKEWGEVSLRGPTPRPVSGHTAQVHEGTVYTFGGESPVGSAIAYTSDVHRLPILVDDETTLRTIVLRYIAARVGERLEALPDTLMEELADL